MRIISKFKDYYDGIQHTIFDKETLYLREKKEIGRVKEPKWCTGSRSEYDLKYGYIGFCGKLILYCHWMNKYGTDEFLYSADKVHEYAESHLENEDYDYYFTGGKYKWSRPYKLEVEKTFADWSRPGNDYHNDFIKYKTPIFMVTIPNRYHVVINPCLSDYNFQRVFDPYTAFQEIYMYLSGVLGGNFKPIPEVSDIDMIEAKGFDKRYSFRKYKQS